MEFFYAVTAAYAVFILWLCSKIMIKAGFQRAWALVLLVPAVNVIMIWVFAFIDWPNLKTRWLRK